MITVCDKNQCAGCMLCVDICPKKAISINDNLKAYNAVIDSEKCVNCNLCHSKCPQNNDVPKKEPINWYQGWIQDEDIRSKSPSGGIGMALATQFVREGGYVASCVFRDGEFQFAITNDEDEVLKFSGSKYVKSNPTRIYGKISAILKEGNKVLFIGLPCQCAAVKKYVDDRYADNLYLVDLICHGTPSPRLLSVFLNQYSKKLLEINDIKFRLKAKMQVVVDDEGIVCKGVSDRYTIGFLNGLTYTDNCYNCKYASGSRITDITIGDSWGSELEVKELKKGVSLMLVQTGKGEALLKKANVELFPVDVENAKRNNDQLVAPMPEPVSREQFFGAVGQKKFNKLIFDRYRNQCIKQDIKHILIRMHLVK
nr:Coenzyme F420 hydrogenase/dehydrogenase, beta subunit C-terminal domain [uncultured Butyrivibrio sp.]